MSKKKSLLFGLRRKPLNERHGKKAAPEMIRARVDHINANGFVRGTDVLSPMGPGKIVKLNLATGELKIRVHPNGRDRHGSTQTYPATAISLL